MQWVSWHWIRGYHSFYSREFDPRNHNEGSMEHYKRDLMDLVTFNVLVSFFDSLFVNS